MDPKTIEQLIKLATFGMAALAEVQRIIQNHLAQEGKSEDEILNDAEATRLKALEVINKL